MTFTYEQWQSISRRFAAQTIEDLHKFAIDYRPSFDIEPRPARINIEMLERLLRASMAEALLSVVTVLPMAGQASTAE